MSKSLFNEEHNNICYLCKVWNYELDKHHLMLGNKHRSLAEEDGLYVYICRKCHSYIHSSKGSTTLHWLKMKAQQKYEESHTREEWLERYKQNYL